jgi:predicted metal-dependent hydrolase
MAKKHYLQHKEKARELLSNKVAYYALIYGVQVKRISIKDQKTRWGSCSTLGNLNFNYKLIFLPDELINLVVVHEICHLFEFNHSKKFWHLVSRQIPDYKNLTRRLRSVRLPALKTKREQLSPRSVLQLFWKIG